MTSDKGKIGLVASLSDMMMELYDTFEAANVYIALPEGIHLAVSRNAGGWYQEDGTLKNFDPSTRYWFQEAAEEGHLIFTDVGDDKETGQLCIVCAMPVYGKNGDLLAVAGSDFFLTDIQEAVQSVGGDGEFHAIVNRDGHVIFSPREEGEFRPTGDLHAGEDKAAGDIEAMDLRHSDNAELAAFKTDVMDGSANARAVTLEDGTYYMAGAAIESVGWTEISVYSQEKANEMVRAMLADFDEIQADAAASYQAGSDRYRILVTLILSAELGCILSTVRTHTWTQRRITP